jgi:hypothetical protein
LKLANGKVEKVKLLGNPTEIQWEQTENSLKVDLAGTNTGSNGYALEISFEN